MGTKVRDGQIAKNMGLPIHYIFAGIFQKTLFPANPPHDFRASECRCPWGYAGRCPIGRRLFANT